MRAGGNLLGALERAHEIGAQIVQVFTQSPRMWKPTQYSPEVLARYRAAQDADTQVAATYCHATYLINPATADSDLLARSRACLVANLEAALGMGASGLVLHLGSHRGRGFEDCAPRVVDVLLGALDEARDPLSGAGTVGRTPPECPILLENAAGAGGTVGRSFEELAAVLGAASAGEALGVCLDTQHLWAAGVAFGSPAEAEDVVRSIEGTVGIGSVRCLHLNDSKVPFASHRDRHENVGEGAIGEKPLSCLLGHPALRGLDAVLEVPGDGHGPRAKDVAAARRIVRVGIRVWDSQER